MKYRIKIIEKKSGEKDYIPQWNDDSCVDWMIKVICYPIVFIFSLIRCDFSWIKDYWWFDIEKPLSENEEDWVQGTEPVKCSTMEIAREETISFHNRHIRELKKQQEENYKERMSKAKVVSYIHLKSTDLHPLK